MGQLVVLGFDGMTAADEVLNKVRSLKVQHLIDLEDAVVVERDAEGKVHIKQAVNLTRLGAASGGLSGAFWGTLVGLLFLNPLLGAAVGAASGAIAGKLSDIGINDDFIRKLGNSIPPGGSGVFILVRKMTADKVLAKLESYHMKGRVLQTSLPEAEEARLREAFDGGKLGSALGVPAADAAPAAAEPATAEPTA